MDSFNRTLPKGYDRDKHPKRPNKLNAKTSLLQGKNSFE